jgi:hypothetical protein
VFHIVCTVAVWHTFIQAVLWHTDTAPYILYCGIIIHLPTARIVAYWNTVLQYALWQIFTFLHSVFWQTDTPSYIPNCYRLIHLATACSVADSYISIQAVLWHTDIPSYSMYCGRVPDYTKKMEISALFPTHSASLSVPILIQKSNLYNIQLHTSATTTCLPKRASRCPFGTDPWPHPHDRVYRRLLVVEENTRAWRKLGILKDHTSLAAHPTHRMILRLQTSGSLRRPVPETSREIMGSYFNFLNKALYALYRLDFMPIQVWRFSWGWNL